MAKPRKPRRNPPLGRRGPTVVPNDCNANGGSCWPACDQGCPCDCHKTPGEGSGLPIWVLAGRLVTEAEHREGVEIECKVFMREIEREPPPPDEPCVHPGHAEDEDEDRKERWRERLAPIRMTEPFMPAVEPAESDEEREARDAIERAAREKSERNPGMDAYVRDSVVERFRNLELD